MKKAVGVIGAIFVFSIVALYLFNPPSSNNDWLNFWGNLLGAFVGAFGAFWVTSYQLKKQRDQQQKEDLEKRKKFRPVFRLYSQDYMGGYDKIVDINKLDSQEDKLPKAYYAKQSDNYVSTIRKITDDAKKDNKEHIHEIKQISDLKYPAIMSIPHNLLTIKNESNYLVSFVIIQIDTGSGTVNFSIKEIPANHTVGLLLPFEFSEDEVINYADNVRDSVTENYKLGRSVDIYCRTVDGEELLTKFNNDGDQFKYLSVEAVDYIGSHYDLITEESMRLPNFRYEIDHSFVLDKEANGPRSKFVGF